MSTMKGKNPLQGHIRSNGLLNFPFSELAP